MTNRHAYMSAHVGGDGVDGELPASICMKEVKTDVKSVLDAGFFDDEPHPALRVKYGDTEGVVVFPKEYAGAPTVFFDPKAEVGLSMAVIAKALAAMDSKPLKHTLYRIEPKIYVDLETAFRLVILPQMRE